MMKYVSLWMKGCLTAEHVVLNRWLVSTAVMFCDERRTPSAPCLMQQTAGCGKALKYHIKRQPA